MGGALLKIIIEIKKKSLVWSDQNFNGTNGFQSEYKGFFFIMGTSPTTKIDCVLTC